MSDNPAHSFLPAQPEGVSPLPLFGRYQRIREIGRGGMGLVVLAHDLELDAPVALKLIPELIVQDTDGITDLKKEVLRGMALTHPGIVRVYTFEHDGTTAAIVMEYVEGQTLGDLKAKQPDRCFDPVTVRPWLEQLCEVLDYAHTEARIAHRDLKPRNLILTPGGRLKVADFGISSSLSDTLSRVSVRVDASGTPPYMSPQQAGGARPSHLDDIYSLGATFYELLTGKPPFFRGNILAQAMEAVPPTLEARRREFEITDREPIPAGWEALLAACLAKDPAARPPNLAAVLRYLDGPPPAAVASSDSRSGTTTSNLPVATTASHPPLSATPSTTSLAAAGPSPMLAATAPDEPLSIRLPETAHTPAPKTNPPIIRVHHPYASTRGTESTGWLRTLIAVQIAAALFAGGLHFVRHWKSAATPTPAPVAATPAKPTPEPGSASNLNPSNSLDIGGLEKPPGPQGRNGPPPPRKPR